MNTKKNSEVKKNCAKVSAKYLDDLSNIFSGVLCMGNWYEPKMPKELKK
ncbi:MAG: cyclic lactone autoinducer peptide [Eubacteriales bacterium]|nr:cyclic lactone autoinducer peptide [Eubacteriales bacterium]